MQSPHTTLKELTLLLKKNNLHTILIKKSLAQAQKSHKDHTRDNGTPYLEEHIYPIIQNLIAAEYKDEKLIAAAILHDVLEDDLNIIEDYFSKTFTKEVYDIVKQLTKTQNNAKTQQEKYDNNKMHLDSITNPKAILIKLADRANNLSCHKENTSPKAKRYIKETQDFYLPRAKRESEYYYKRLKGILQTLRKAVQ